MKNNNGLFKILYSDEEETSHEKLYGPMRPVSYYTDLYGAMYFEIIQDTWNWLRKMKPQWRVAWTKEDDDAFFEHLIEKVQTRGLTCSSSIDSL